MKKRTRKKAGNDTCPKCGNGLKVLQERNEPEGLRYDRYCGGCKTTFRTHKHGYEEVRKKAGSVKVLAWGFKRNGKLYPYASRTNKAVEASVLANPGLWGDIQIVRVEIREITAASKEGK